VASFFLVLIEYWSVVVSKVSSDSSTNGTSVLVRLGGGVKMDFCSGSTILGKIVEF
jgi:hypothetical protein